MASTQSGPVEFSAVRERIRTQMLEQGVPSLAVAVARDGEILWEEGFGWADREQRVPATEHTLYSLASISKPITATGLMVLVERGKLELDRPVNEYLGDAKLTAHVGDAAEATVRRVANHTSGLALHFHFFPDDEPCRRPPMDETIRRYGHLVWAPGERYYYSNLGYGLLDHLIARLSGKSYPDFMRSEVFLPLGMTRASVHIAPGLEPFAAARYDPEGARIPFYDFDHPGGSAVYCSAHDLVRFGMFHHQAHLPDQKAILSDETLAAMQASTSAPEKPSGYGIGWSTEEEHGYRIVSHGGGMRGVSTSLVLVPSEKIVVASLANSSCGLAYQLPPEILDVLLPDYGERRAEAEAKKKEEAEAKKEPEAGFRPPPDLLGVWRGAVHTYQGERPLILEFKESGDIHAQLGDTPRTLVNEARLEDGFLSGRMMGEIGTEDSDRRLHRLHLALKPRGDALNGAVITVSVPSKRLTNGLSHWAELRKADSE